ncbi:hypothetical protein IQ273_05365 [Nodosilinea sp. LEGE 07298]|jgi:hypothetical protein|uniref:hypothetical protein n=1 Tax=Nodosilinea sp. LEGE 07298 TaxID=2777970 RepID=UPI00187FF70D|nr:hypothetical protein [Nodosilinea sp. LEGE 07298]MBE9108846.1 hypothetical protein [Nodosilinea sp. LEGE 07298]
MAQVKNGATAEAEVDMSAADDAIAPDGVESVDSDQIDDLFKDLKTLLNTVEKLQKARQDVGDIKPLILRLLDGELLSGEELEELRGGIGGLSKILKLYNDYQTALERAQPARTILDQLMKS